MITSLSGSGAHPHYHALWHLHTLGVLGASGEAGEHWRAAAERLAGSGARETRVALLDNSVASAHPNLAGAVDATRTIDFVSARLGAFPARRHAETFAAADAGEASTATGASEPPEPPKTFEPEDGATDTARALASAAGPLAESLLDELLGRLACPPDDGRDRALAATRAAFSAHGTAMAGLIGARPAKVDARTVEVAGELDDALVRALSAESTVLPYAGVDPFCHIVPVSTSFDPDPEQYALALLYAVLVDADIIVLARDFPDPFRSNVTSGESGDSAVPLARLRTAPTAEETASWHELERLLLAISRHVPILCAAGNGSGERAIYPASLAGEDNGIVSVGAFTADGRVAGYSASGRTVDLLAPSADGERLDRELQRLDPLARTDDHPDPVLARHLARQTAAGSPDAPTSTDRPAAYCPQDLISTDVPGAFGYNRGHTPSSVADASVDDPASCYCRFGGTSGAVAVAAGYLSLLYSSGHLVRRGGGEDGVIAKRALLASGIDAHVAAPT